MAQETLLPDGTYSGTGWTGTGSNITEGIASADGNVIQSDSDGEGDVVTIDFANPTSITDADTVTQVDIYVRGRVQTDGGDESFDVSLLIGSVSQGTVTGTPGELNATQQTLGPLNTAGWNSDWTLSQLQGLQVNVVGAQTGMPTANVWEIDTLEVVITYTPAAGGTVYERTLSDNVDIVDPQTRSQAMGRALLSALDLTDGGAESFTNTEAYARNAVVIADLISRAVTGPAGTVYDRTLQDYIDANELTLRKSTQYNIEMYDSVDSIADAVSSAVASIVGRVLSSSVNVSDFISRTALLIRLVSDNTVVTDTIVADIVRNIARNLQSNVNINDVINVAKYLTIERVLQSNLSVTDAITSSMASVIGRILSSSVSVSDFISRVSLVSRLLQDNTEVSDSVVIIKLLILDRTLVDLVNVNDSIIRTVLTVGTIERILQDSINVFDELAVRQWLVRQLGDYVDITDSVVRSVSAAGSIISRIMQDSVSLQDTEQHYLLMVRSVIDQLSVIDSILREASFVRLLSDNVDLTDALSKESVSIILRSLADYININDSLVADLSVLVTGIIIAALNQENIDTEFVRDTAGAANNMTPFSEYIGSYGGQSFWLYGSAIAPASSVDVSVDDQTVTLLKLQNSVDASPFKHHYRQDESQSTYHKDWMWGGYFKKDVFKYIRLSLNDWPYSDNASPVKWAVFDIELGTIVEGDDGFAGILDKGNGVYRCWVRGAVNTLRIVPVVFLLNDSLELTYTGNGESIYGGGFMLCAGAQSYPEYIKNPKELLDNYSKSIYSESGMAATDLEKEFIDAGLERYAL